MRRYLHPKRIRFCIYLISGAVLVPLLLFQVANRLFALPVEKLHQPPSTVVLDRHGEWLRAFIASDESWHIPEASLDENLAKTANRGVDIRRPLVLPPLWD